MSNKPRIIFFDLETTPILNLRWQFDRSPYINHNAIVEDWSIICGAWKVIGESKVNAVNVDKVGSDYKVVKKIRDILATADIIGGHYIDNFDMKILNARMIYHRIEPLPQIPTIDTKKVAKKIGAFTSNRLDYLAKYTLGAGKIPVDFQLWLDVRSGSKAAMKKMVEYNKMDVQRNVETYEVFLPYIKNHPHVGVLNGHSKNHSCPNCGSHKLKRNGTRPTSAGVLKQEVQCLGCGSYHRIPIEK